MYRWKYIQPTDVYISIYTYNKKTAKCRLKSSKIPNFRSSIAVSKELEKLKRISDQNKKIN